MNPNLISKIINIKSSERCEGWLVLVPIEILHQSPNDYILSYFQIPDEDRYSKTFFTSFMLYNHEDLWDKFLSLDISICIIPTIFNHNHDHDHDQDQDDIFTDLVDELSGYIYEIPSNEYRIKKMYSVRDNSKDNFIKVKKILQKYKNILKNNLVRMSDKYYIFDRIVFEKMHHQPKN